MKTLSTFLAATALTVVGIAATAEKWDMPMAYSASNFHSAVGAEFASCVTTGTGGDIEIVTHPWWIVISWRPNQTGNPDRASSDW